MIITTRRLRYDSWRRNANLFTIVILTRFITGMHLVDSGLRKMLGERQSGGSDTNLLFFLDGFFQLGFYWSWVGMVELLTALLLMGQRLAAFGALLCVFVASNVGMLGISIGWGKITPQVLVLFSALALLVWDFYKLRPLFMTGENEINEPKTIYPEAGQPWRHAGLCLFLACIAGFVLKEAFPSGTRLVHQLTAIIFFVVCSLAYILGEKQRKEKRIP